jgi:hypothetical protein
MEDKVEGTDRMTLKLWRWILSVLVVVSLALNGFLIYSLLNFRRGLLSALAAARNSLVMMEDQPMVFSVTVDEEVPIQTTIPIEQTFVMPLQFDYPLDTVVNTQIDIPILGTQELAIPVQTVIPISYTLDIPIRTEVPISLTYRLQQEIPVEVVMPAEALGSLSDLIERLAEESQLGLK